jgi:hypothetical protein
MMKNVFQACCDLQGFNLTSSMKRDHLFDLIYAYGLNDTVGLGFYKAKTKFGANYCGFSFRTVDKINGDVRIFSSRAIMITWTSSPLNEFNKKVNLKSIESFHTWVKNKSNELNSLVKNVA